MPLAHRPWAPDELISKLIEHTCEKEDEDMHIVHLNYARARLAGFEMRRFGTFCLCLFHLLL